MKLNPTLLGLAAGATLALAPQLAQAQNSIAITGGTLNIGVTLDYQITTAQGSGTLVGSGGTSANCNGCFAEIYDAVSGTGFSPSGPVVFSGVPVVVRIDTPVGSSANILGGEFNSTTVISGVGAGVTQATIANFFSSTLGVSGPVSSPDFSAGNFSFDTPFSQNTTTISPPTTNFAPPEPLTEPGGRQQPDPEEVFGEDTEIVNLPQGRSFRPNGMHTRIIPAWTPGLYQ
jgi:hypothetical protein